MSTGFHPRRGDKQLQFLALNSVLWSCAINTVLLTRQTVQSYRHANPRLSPTETKIGSA